MVSMSHDWKGGEQPVEAQMATGWPQFVAASTMCQVDHVQIHLGTTCAGVLTGTATRLQLS
jgi:hypothetical protein